MPVTININDLSLCHKGSDGIAIATVPDVCKTPSPGGPVPIPYPNIAMSKDLAQGTTTVTVDGGNMAANLGSQFMLSTGDEAGVAGGVASSTFIKEATWLTYSFDVKLEGKSACRLTDKMFMNHNNTVCCGGLFQKFLTAAGGDVAQACADLWKKITDLIGEGVTGKTNGIRGLEERFNQQRTGQMSPNDPPDRGPNPEIKLYPNGSNGWQRHDNEIATQQQTLEKHLDEFEQNCGGPTPETQKAREWVTKQRPQSSAFGQSNSTNLLLAIFVIAAVSCVVTGGGAAPVAVPIAAAAAVMLGIGLSGGGDSSPGA